MIKSGQNVYIETIKYLFLGYTDYKRKYAKVSDRHGNTAIVEVSRITLPR